MSTTSNSENSSSSSSSTTSTSQSTNQVLVIGSANQDLISYTHHLPKPGETVLGSKFQTCCGGKGANQAVAAANLNICPIAMLCKVGRDDFGKMILNNFDQANVQYDPSTIFAEEGITTGVAQITVDHRGENSIVVIPGANTELTPEHVKNAILRLHNNATNSPPPKVVVVQLEIFLYTALEALKCAKQVNALTILNTAPAPTGMLDEDFYRLSDVMISNEHELKVLTNEDYGSVLDKEEEETTTSRSSNTKSFRSSEEEARAKVLLDRGVRQAVIVTLGSRGALVVKKNGEVIRVNVPTGDSWSNKPVVDTVGAGDAFVGALAAYLSRGVDMEHGVKIACGVASMSVRKHGVQSSYPMFSDLPDSFQMSPPSPSLILDNQKEKPSITFVTGNKKKLEEVIQILTPTNNPSSSSSLGYNIINQKIDLPELQGTPTDIAISKCKIASKSISGPVFTEDTSLSFNALNGMPGPYIKWFLQDCGHDGLNDMLVGFDDKSAYAETIVAYCEGYGEEVMLFTGRTYGKIVRARGSLDFGWDPIFEPDEGEGRTYAEMTKDEKNAISHRGRSFAKFRDYIYSHKKSDVIQ
eukprot:CAMPEP_0195523670 /NCGR_PEP_ID=MMETSP0794_2-20130614/23001_1 /TAXON_ID=515487 /ORGANISM="Stephanopyxis turris, Strain CCMP 815" /LENGTH=583 /DNA_ID=CAMNT_0040653715 /DNA_START=394 /DNA_END=2145 /DNA_ORIENTATION=+